MTFTDWLWGVVWIVAAFPVLIVMAYVIVRVAAFAHFRTKLEYLRSALKELGKGEHSDGKGT